VLRWAKEAWAEQRDSKRHRGQHLPYCYLFELIKKQASMKHMVQH